MTKRALIVLTAFVLVLTAAMPVSALPYLGGETNGYINEIFDGVTHTYMETEGVAYGKQKIHAIEFDLAQRNLDLEILKNDYIVSKKTVPSFVSTYNNENKANGKEIIAAVNGDLWMTGVHSGSQVSKSILCVPRGVLISEGVVYCSSQIPNESTYTTNKEGHSYFWAFGVTEDYVPMIGQPIISFAVKNTTQNTAVSTDALNRLPAHDSLVIYDGNCNYTNYALDDAYEVVLTDINGIFKYGTTVSGTVSAIYGPNDSTSPNLTKDSIVLTARGSAIADIEKYALGDKVEIDMSVRDISGRDNDWTKAVTAIGGHIPLVLDGASTEPGDATMYPTTMIGIKNDGKVVIFQNDGRQPLWSQGLAINKADDFMLQMGVNTAIILDGGGSSTMVVGTELVNKPSDGTPRAVINGLALVSCSERGEQAEFEVNMPYRFDARYIKFDTNGALSQLSQNHRNDTNTKLVDGVARLQPSRSTNDPYVYYGVSSAFNTLSAGRYKYMVIKYRTSEKVTTPSTELFLCSGSISGPTGGYSVSFNHGTAGQWNTQIMDFSSLSYWSGEIYGVRLDYFAGNAGEDEYFDIEYIAFAKTQEDAEAFAAGTASIPTAPAEATGITVRAGGSYKIENGMLLGVKSDSLTYDVINGINGVKLEMYGKDGAQLRAETVYTGCKVVTHNISLEKADELTVIVTGDVNGDGYADNMDAAAVLRYDAGITELDSLQLAAGDVNGDGEVNNLDAAYILKIDAGLIDL